MKKKISFVAVVEGSVIPERWQEGYVSTADGRMKRKRIHSSSPLRREMQV